MGTDTTGGRSVQADGEGQAGYSEIGDAIERENTASNLGLKRGRGGSDGESHD